jgi:hypothetical protein
VPSPVAESLRSLGAALGELGLRWYLFGAQAALIHGAARLTADVDATVDLAAVPLPRLLATLAAHGFEPRVADVAEFARRARVAPLLHGKSDVPVDLVLAGPGPEMLFLERARPTSIEGVTVPVAAPEDVITMKLLAGRPKDFEDVVAIVACGKNLRLEITREMLRALERALDRRDLLRELERAIREAAS